MIKTVSGGLQSSKDICQEVKTLDKYEYNLKLDEIKKLVTGGNYEDAVKIADTIEWKRVRNTRTLCMISEIYEANDRLEDSKEILLRAYRRSQMTRTVLFRLTEVAIKMKEFDEKMKLEREKLAFEKQKHQEDNALKDKISIRQFKNRSTSK